MNRHRKENTDKLKHCFKETLKNFWNASKSVLIRGRDGTRVLTVHLLCIGSVNACLLKVNLISKNSEF